MDAATVKTTLGNVCKLITDGKHGDCENQANSGYYFLSAKDIRNGKLLYNDARQITEADFLSTHRRTQLEPLDIVIISTGATIGRMALVPHAELTPRTTFQKSVAILKPNNDIVVPHWLYYYIQGDLNRLIGYAGGTAQPNLLLRDLRSFEINVPPLETQRKIATVLSAYDDLIENNTRRLKLMEQAAHDLYREWFVEFRFPGHEQVPLVESELGLTPMAWEVKTFGEMTLNFDKLRVPVSSIERSKGIYPYYGASGIVDYVNEYIFEGRYLLVSEDGENLRTRKTPIAFFATGRFWVNNHAHIVQGKPPTSSDFLKIALDICDISPYITGAAQPKLSQSYLNGIRFLIATDEIQSQFNEFAEDCLRQIESLEAKNANLRQSRNLLLPRLMSGEVDVSTLNLQID